MTIPDPILFGLTTGASTSRLAALLFLLLAACGGGSSGGAEGESESEGEGEGLVLPDDRIASCASAPVLGQCREYHASDDAPNDVFDEAEEYCTSQSWVWGSGGCPGGSCGGCAIEGGDCPVAGPDYVVVEWYYDPTDLQCFNVANSVTMQDCENCGGIWAEQE